MAKLLLPKELREFIALLNAEGVEYVVVGGYALAIHGRPRMTGDVDLFVRCSPENAARIVLVLKRFGVESIGFTKEDFEDPDTVVQFGRPPNRIDILTGIDGVTFDEAWADRVETNLDGVTAYVISKAGLIRNKRASGRLKDNADLESL